MPIKSQKERKGRKMGEGGDTIRELDRPGVMVSVSDSGT